MVVIVDENAPPRNVAITSSPGKVGLEDALTPSKTILASPAKILQGDAQETRASPVPDKVEMSPLCERGQTHASPALDKVEMSPLCERGQKRSALTASLPESDRVEKTRLVDDVPIAEDGSKSTTGSPHTASLLSDAESAAASSDAEHGAQAGQEDCPESLESYKTVIDATTEVQEDREAQIPVLQTLEEWQDPATGATLEYATANDWNDGAATTPETSAEHTGSSIADVTQVECAADASEDIASLSQVTVAWEEPATGAMLGYTLCDDADEDVQAMRCLFQEHENQADTPTDKLEITVENEEVEQLVSGDDAIEDNEIEATVPQKATEWKDPDSGVMMGFTCDEESEAGDHIDEPYMTFDPVSGIMMGYAHDEDSDSGDHLDGSDTKRDPESGVVMGYECDEESEFGDHLDEPYMKRDLDSGVVMGYECDEDSDFGEHVDEPYMKRDPDSGIVMGYACDDESEFGDHLEDPYMKHDPDSGITMGYAFDEGSELGDQHDGPGNEWEDPQCGAWFGWEACEEVGEEDSSSDDHAPEWEDLENGALLGYGACEDASDEDKSSDESGIHDNIEDQAKPETRDPPAKERHSRGGSLKRRFRPMVLRLRKQHIKRVIKRSRDIKSKRLHK